MNINDFLTFARSVMNEHGLHIWELAIDRAARRAGCCNYTTRTLSFSKHFVENNDQSVILDTLLHEISHSLVGPGHGHGIAWQLKCKQIGLSKPVRCLENADMPKGKYQAICGSCGPINAYRHRLSERSNKQKHAACKTLVKWEVVK